jgi:predicted secreted hydrolase
MGILRIGLAALLALTGCGSLAAAPPAGSPVGIRALGADPRAFSRADVIARSADVLAEAARASDDATLARFLSYARGADADPAATRAMAQGAQRQIAGVRGISAAWRAGLAEVAGRKADPVPAPKTAPIAFPRDEGAHWDAITEWWYVNGHLEGGPERFGYEFTLFRVGPLLLFAHVALTDETGKAFRYVRDWYRPGQTATAKERLDTRYGTERVAATADGAYHLSGTVGNDAGFELDLVSRKRPMLINGDGNIDMPEGKDSRYYSLTRLDSAGTVRIGDRSVPVRGLSWLDHQWGPFYVSGFRELWDWFSVQADDGSDYNLFAFRKADGTPVARYVNRLDASGTFRGGERLDFTRDKSWTSPRTGLRYTTAWTLALPDAGEQLKLEAVLPDQEVARLLPFPADPLPQYWEGRMRVQKTQPTGGTVGGVGYAETFGFSK